MIFPVNASLLDAVVLSVIEEEDTYGYKITQEVNNIINISESTLYPVLRRLQKNADLEVYDMEYLGRNRRYYKITVKGKELLGIYKEEWVEYKQKIDKVLGGGVNAQPPSGDELIVPQGYSRAEKKLKAAASPAKDEFLDTLELCEEIERVAAGFFDKGKADALAGGNNDNGIIKNDAEEAAR